MWCTGRCFTHKAAGCLAVLLCADIAGVATARRNCSLPWNAIPTGSGINVSATCPYGRRLPGDVTLPNDRDNLTLICVGYGYVPMIIVFLAFIELTVKAPLTRLIRWSESESQFSGSVSRRSMRANLSLYTLGTRELSFMVFCVVIVILNEVVLKNLVLEPRPDMSCNFTCGFPSGHATLAIGFFALMLLDGIYRVTPFMPMTARDARLERMQGNVHVRETLSALRMVTLVPFSAKDAMSHSEFVAFGIFWMVVLVPVPFTRIYLDDHTPRQVFAGSVFGVLEASIWFSIVRTAQWRFNKYIGQRFAKIIYHNLALPRFIVRTSCLRLLAECETAEELNEVNRLKLTTMRDEISFYLDMTIRATGNATRPSEGAGTNTELLVSVHAENFLCFERQILEALLAIIYMFLQEDRPASLPPLPSGVCTGANGQVLVLDFLELHSFVPACVTQERLRDRLSDYSGELQMSATHRSRPSGELTFGIQGGARQISVDTPGSQSRPTSVEEEAGEAAATLPLYKREPAEESLRGSFASGGGGGSHQGGMEQSGGKDEKQGAPPTPQESLQSPWHEAEEGRGGHAAEDPSGLAGRQGSS